MIVSYDTIAVKHLQAFLHVTRERIRQIEAKALRKLKHPTRAKKLRGYLKEI